MFVPVTKEDVDVHFGLIECEGDHPHELREASWWCEMDATWRCGSCKDKMEKEF